ncbi:hypothetical protein NGRA_1433 [Nosema granulosis]|uniref:DUF5096 domain-containing protein n=1 Tax=Nosema granulosis TaxID=83296 RepID=A0A9P6H023_9MICR|nr:hypothetical protein NGRA_1433 [Nosema granulosis]
MEEYFERRMKFVTQGGSINGILKGFDEENEVFKIIINKEEFNLDVNDVLEMIPDSFTSDSLTSDTTSKTTSTNKTTSDTTGKTTSTSDTTNKTTSSIDLLVNQSQYNEILSLAFTKFGPTREEFVLCGAQNLLKLLRLLLKDSSNKIDIVLGDNSLYNSIGLTLARLSLLHGFDVRVVGNFEDIESLKYLFIFKQNGGSHSSRVRTTTDFIVNTSEDKEIEVDESVGGVVSFGVPSTHPVSYLVCFGASIYEKVKDRDYFYLIDVMIPEKIYCQYKLTRLGMRPAKKIKPNA